MAPSEEELAQQGWSRRSTTDEPQLSQVVAMYLGLGFEVRVERFRPEPGQRCVECMLEQPDRYQTIYVRKRS